MNDDNNLRLPTDAESFEPINPIRLQRGERLEITRKGNKTIYEIVDAQPTGCAHNFFGILLVTALAIFFIKAQLKTESDASAARSEKKPTQELPLPKSW